MVPSVELGDRNSRDLILSKILIWLKGIPQKEKTTSPIQIILYPYKLF